MPTLLTNAFCLNKQYQQSARTEALMQYAKCKDHHPNPLFNSLRAIPSSQNKPHFLLFAVSPAFLLLILD